MANTTTTTTSTTSTPPPLRFIAGADSNGCTLKDTLISHLTSLHIPVDDLGVGPYYSIADQVARRVSSSSSTTTTLGLVACGTGVGVGIFANKTPGIYAATCLTVSDAINARSINNGNILAVSGMSTTSSTAVDILTAFINTPFKSPCPASGNLPWPSDIDSFLDTSLNEMPLIGCQQIPNPSTTTTTDCAICYCVAKEREFTPVDIIPGGMMKIVRESPTSAIIKFKAGSVEPAHHHTFGHDLLVIKGKKRVWNLSKNQKHDLIDGDYLFTPAGDVHRVKYFEDTEFFLKWDGPWDIIMDEDLDSAKAAIAKEES